MHAVRVQACSLAEYFCVTTRARSPQRTSVGSPESRSPSNFEIQDRGLGSAIAAAKDLPWGKFVSSQGLWAATIAHAANNWGLYVSLAWLPTFFTQQYGMDLGK